MANTRRSSSLYVPRTNYGSQSEFNVYNTPSKESTDYPQVIRLLSPEDVQKLKYKIELGSKKKMSSILFYFLFYFIIDKQVAEKQQRRTREWENKIQRDKKYVS